MKRVTGIGGIFFKCKDPEKMKTWYKNHLGIDSGEYKAVFQWQNSSTDSRTGSTSWSLFSETSEYFNPSDSSFMINYRVDNLEKLVEQLKKENVTILDKMESYDYGKFIHILETENNKIELWEPLNE